MVIRRYKRNYQLANTLLLLSFVVGSTLFLTSFEVGIQSLVILQWSLLFFFLVCALLEYFLPFAVISDRKIVVREHFFKKQTIPRQGMYKVINSKNRQLIIKMRHSYDRCVSLKSLNNKVKLLFVKDLYRLSSLDNTRS